jgi:hypothetical protein
VQLLISVGGDVNARDQYTTYDDVSRRYRDALINGGCRPSAIVRTHSLQYTVLYERDTHFGRPLPETLSSAGATPLIYAAMGAAAPLTDAERVRTCVQLLLNAGD